LKLFGEHENQACFPALLDGGGIWLGVKNDLLACLEDFSQPKSEVPPTSCTVLDRAVIIQLLQQKASASMHKLHQATRLQLVWDHYITDR